MINKKHFLTILMPKTLQLTRARNKYEIIFSSLEGSTNTSKVKALNVTEVDTKKHSMEREGATQVATNLPWRKFCVHRVTICPDTTHNGCQWQYYTKNEIWKNWEMAYTIIHKCNRYVTFLNATVWQLLSKADLFIMVCNCMLDSIQF